MIDGQYEYLLYKIHHFGTTKTDRTGTGTKSIFGAQLRYNLRDGFPLITSRRIKFECVVDELLWFLSGSTNVNDLPERTQPWWRPWAKVNGDLGPIYGQQWRDWEALYAYVDQIKEVISEIKRNPDSRRLIVSAWNVGELHLMALPPCHVLFQFYVADGKLSCQLYQRSADMFLGVPANIASYSLLTHMIARECDLAVGEFIWTGGDCHVYRNHAEQVEEQLSRNVRPFPTLVFTPAERSGIFSYEADDIGVLGYDPHPHIAAKVAV